MSWMVWEVWGHVVKVSGPFYTTHLKVASGGFYGVWLLIMEIRARTREAAPSTRR